MLMWHPNKELPLSKQYLAHMKHHLTTKDVMFSKKDIWPTLMQPFLLTSYYEICRERKMKLPVVGGVSIMSTAFVSLKSGIAVANV